MGRRAWGIKKMQHHVALTPNTNPAEQFTPLSSRIPETRRSKVKVNGKKKRMTRTRNRKNPEKRKGDGGGCRRRTTDDGRRRTGGSRSCHKGMLQDMTLKT